MWRTMASIVAGRSLCPDQLADHSAIRVFICSLLTRRPFPDVAFRLVDCREKRNFPGDVVVIDIIRKPVNGLKNLILDAHERKLAEPE
jgi:hypothetical protein